MNSLRSFVPILGICALITLFFMLPESPGIGCTSCYSGSPYIPLFGIGYFSLITAIAWLFPSFPNRYLAGCGFIWALLLAAVLTFIHLPQWCRLCLIGHFCNILIWTIWLLAPSKTREEGGRLWREKVCLVVLAPISVVGLFSTLNLTFMAYGLKQHKVSKVGLHVGDQVPSFSATTLDGGVITDLELATSQGVVVNFVSADCQYCKEQLQILNTVREYLIDHPYRLINISKEVPQDLVGVLPKMEWIEDKDDSLRHRFKVAGYPTLFLIRDGKISQAIQGVPDQLKTYLVTGLIGCSESERK